MTLRELLVIAGLCALTEDGDEAVRLALAEEVVHLFGEDAFERLDAIEASNEESEEVMLQILRSLAVDQELLDVKAGIPARDAEIEALRKEIETLQSQHANIEAFVACDASAISYLSLGEYRTALLKMLRQKPATKEPGA